VQVQLLFFASLADTIGSRRLTLDVPEDTTVERLLDRLTELHPGVEKYRPVLLTAVNQEYAGPGHGLGEGDEVAIFPPVSGGSASAGPLVSSSPGRHYEITREPIDSERLARHLLASGDGAISIFEGVVRDNSGGRKTEFLVYEAYEQMALAKLEEIGRLVAGVWEVGSIGIVHRLGRLEIGEASVAVIVTSPHRRAAFDACHYAIDRLKKVVPIWKKEHFEGGDIWIEGQG
jgi:molybdopterin synthase catalytic subunit